MKIRQAVLPLLAITIGSLSTVAAEGFELRQLNEDNFKSSTAQGLWFVEHYSPKCGHCRAFAPTWAQLSEDKQPLERLSGFHMAQVNCLAQGDLCNENGIKFYPQLMLYSDGVLQPSYNGDRSYSDLSRYIDQHASEYAAKVTSQSGSVEKLATARPNLDGKILELDEEGLAAIRAKGPVLTEFFAPWCGHCKKLRPIYEKVAEALRGQVNVAAVDCEAHKAFCRREGVMGYPTLRMLDGEESRDFAGTRSMEGIRDFALEASTREPLQVQQIKAADFDEILRSNDVFFLYLQNFDTAPADAELVKGELEKILPTVPSFTSSDPQIYSHLRVGNPPPTSALLAFSSHNIQPVATITFPSNHRAVEQFININKYPALVHLDSSNYKSIMYPESKSVVVLGAVRRGLEGERDKEELLRVSRAWKRGGRKFDRPVVFAWIEGDKWGNWLRNYGIRKTEFPAIVVVDTQASEYYDTTIEGKKVQFGGADVFSVLEGYYQHFLRPKPVESTFEWGSRSAALWLISVSQTTEEHPLLAFGLLVGGVAIFVWTLQRCISRDVREAKEAPRLD